MHDRTSFAEGAIAEMSQQRAYVLIWIPEHLADNVCLRRIECPQRVELRTVHLQLMLLVVAEVLLNHVKRKVGNYETGSVDVFVSAHVWRLALPDALADPGNVHQHIRWELQIVWRNPHVAIREHSDQLGWQPQKWRGTGLARLGWHTGLAHWAGTPRLAQPTVAELT